MQLFIEQSSFKTIYSSSPKLVIADCDRHVWEKININNEFDVYIFKIDPKLGSGYLIGSNTEVAENELLESIIAPNFFSGAIAFSDAGKQKLTKLINWWSSKSIPQSIPKLIVIDRKQQAAQLQANFWQQMYQTMAQQDRDTSERIATLQRQYLGLRKLHEDMQNAFSTVEAYLSQAKLPPIQLVFDTPIIDKSVDPLQINNSNSPILKQLLPVSYRGLAAIELHIDKQYPEARGDLIVSLKACEDKTANTVWKIPYQHLSPGWWNLDLPYIDLGRKRDVELIIEWQTRISPAPSLSLGKQQPILESRAYNDEITLENSLAIRIWQGLPGTRKVTSPYLISTNYQEKMQPQLGYLGQRAMAAAQEVTPNLPTDAFSHIQVLDNGAKIVTHPRADGTATIAMLPYCFPATANRLTASVITNHEAAGIIEYAIAIIKPEVEPKQALSHNLAEAFSDWIAVEANTPREITIDLTRSVAVNCHIVIAARFPQNSPSDFAWAHWINFYSAIAHSDSLIQTAEPARLKEDKANNSKTIDPQSVKPISTSITENIPSQTIETEARELTRDSAPVRLRDASVGSLQTEFNRVQLIERENKIQVHPVRDEDTIAIVANAIAPNVTKVRSTVCTENEAASAIEYAIAVIAEDDNTSARLAISSPTSALGFSGWQLVEANTLQNIDLNLNVPTKDICHLVLATRLPEHGNQSNAHARWINIEFD